MNNFGSPLHYFGHNYENMNLLYESFLQGKHFNKIYEPFCGSASFTLCALNKGLAKQYIINDIYKPIADTLLAIKKHHRNIIEKYAHHFKTINTLQEISAKRGYYDEVKYQFNKDPSKYIKGDFLFLNNFTKYYLPIIQENEYLSEFNFSNKFEDSQRYVENQLIYFANLLNKSSTEITNKHFQSILQNTTKDDLIFMDPPFPDLSDNIYSRTENRKILHEQLIEQINLFNKNGTAFILLYGTLGVDQSYLLDIQPDINKRSCFN